ncbi:MAG: hypothetical protein FWF72_06785 [Paludibacter sp.]|nr:hypothetical protein [Paludibacter sp.]
MTKEEYIQQVVTILNEADISVMDAIMIGSDMTKVALYAERLYPAAWRRAVAVFPHSWFELKSFAHLPRVENKPEGTGYILLPLDFLLLSSFKMACWNVACNDAYEETPYINARQANEYTRGTPQRPVCVLRNTSPPNPLSEGEGELGVRKALYYYSVPKEAANSGESFAIEQALYIPNVTALTEIAGRVDIDHKLCVPLAYMNAAQVLTSFEKHDTAKALEERAKQMRGDT